MPIVTDDEGAASSRSFTVLVANQAPLVSSASTLIGIEGAALNYTARFSDSGIRDTHTAMIDWGDGTSSPGLVTESNGRGTVKASHVFADNGSYTVRVQVVDNSGAAGTRVSSATIGNAAPVLTADIAYESQTAGDLQQVVAVVSGIFTDPGFDRPEAGTRETFVVTMDWGDGTVEESWPVVVQGSPGVLTIGSFSARHAYSGGGIYQATVTIRDDDGGSASKSLVFCVATIDIKPAIRAPNYNPIGNDDPGNSLPRGLLPVVIYSDATFDATQINCSTLRFSPGDAPENNNELIRFQALPNDGRMDVVAHFDTWATSIGPDDTFGVVTGYLADGTYFVGADTIRVPPLSSQIPDVLQQPLIANTKFYVANNLANSSAAETVFRYAATGSGTGLFQLPTAVADPRGVASNLSGDTLWIIDGTS